MSVLGVILIDFQCFSAENCHDSCGLSLLKRNKPSPCSSSKRNKAKLEETAGGRAVLAITEELDQIGVHRLAQVYFRVLKDYALVSSAPRKLLSKVDGFLFQVCLLSIDVSNVKYHSSLFNIEYFCSRGSPFPVPLPGVHVHQH